MEVRLDMKQEITRLCMHLDSLYPNYKRDVRICADGFRDYFLLPKRNLYFTLVFSSKKPKCCDDVYRIENCGPEWRNLGIYNERTNKWENPTLHLSFGAFLRDEFFPYSKTGYMWVEY